MAPEDGGGVDERRFTAAAGQQLDNDVLQVRIAVVAVVFSPERRVGKVMAWEAREAVVPSRGQRAGVSLHSPFLRGQGNDVPVPKLLEKTRQRCHGQLTLNMPRVTIHRLNDQEASRGVCGPLLEVVK